METQEYEQQLVKRLINEFKAEFKAKTGKEVEVVVKGFSVQEFEYKRIPTLQEILDIISSFLPRDKRHISLRSQRRFKEVLDLRKIYSKIARDFGYTLFSIGKAIDRDHSTIIHNLREGESLLSSEEPFRILYNSVVKQIQNDFGLFPSSPQEPANSEPVLLDAVLSE